MAENTRKTRQARIKKLVLTFHECELPHTENAALVRRAIKGAKTTKRSVASTICVAKREAAMAAAAIAAE
jgi:hypothetical protein